MRETDAPGIIDPGGPLEFEEPRKQKPSKQSGDVMSAFCPIETGAGKSVPHEPRFQANSEIAQPFSAFLSDFVLFVAERRPELHRLGRHIQLDSHSPRQMRITAAGKT
jgi:hypothetical protein